MKQDTVNVPAEMSFSGNVAMNWIKFKKRFTLYMEATEKDTKPDKQKIATLLNLMGDEAVDIHDTFSYSEGEDENKFDIVLAKFDKYCQPRKNVIFDRFKFFSRSQEPNETVDKYVTELKKLANPCDFGDQLENLIRDRLVLGIADKNVQERLLRDADLKLDKALNHCRSSEQSKKQLLEIAGTSTNKEVSVVKNKLKFVKKRSNSEGTNYLKCRKCGLSHSSASKCPAEGKFCMKCKGKNHFATVCSKSKKSVKMVEKQHEDTEESDEERNHELLAITKKIHGVAWKEDVQVSGKILTFKIDTGSEVNIMSKSVYDLLPHKIALATTKSKLTSYTGHEIDTLGKCSLNCSLNGNNKTLQFFIAKGKNTESIIGLSDATRLDLLPRSRVHVIKYKTGKEMISEFSEVFADKASTIKIAPYHITLKNDAIATISPARRVPIALKKKLKAELEAMVKNQVLEVVNEPTDWVHPIVIVSKPNGSIRICMDPRPLNKNIKREHYSLPTVDSVIAELNGAEYFTVLDATTAFLQVPIDESSSNLCTIATPFGRYRYKTMPYGINSAPEVYQKLINHIFDGLEGVVPYIDDVLIWGKTIEEHNIRLRGALERARKYNVKFSKAKMQLCKTEIKFLGHKLNKEGISIENSKIDAINALNSPKNKKDLQRILGMINYLAKFVPNLSQSTSTIRHLLSDKVEFIWGENEENCFKKLKDAISTAPVLKFYDPNKQLCLSVDSSSHGLGAVVLQEKQPVGYSSTALNKTQQAYAQIEKELLAILHGLVRFHAYTFGREVLVQTDHKPLLSIVNKPMEALTPRLQRMVLKLMRYNYTLEYVPGKELYIADTLSRDPNTKRSIDTKYLEGKTVSVSSIVCTTPERLSEFRKSTQSDPVTQEIISFINNGWPEHKRAIKCNDVKKFWEIKEELHFADNVLLKGNRIVIPRNEVMTILKNLHNSHQGVTSCQNRAKTIWFWPGMLKDIEDFVLNCQTCQRHSRSNIKQPLKVHEVPDLPWSKIGMDFAHIKGSDYLIIIDYFSKFILTKKITSKTSQSTIKIIEDTFAYLGIPQEVMTDNGPPFNALDFKAFMNEYGIRHLTSSPTYARSNGLVERAVQTVKNLFVKAIESGSSLTLSILNYNATPKHNLPSPAELLMGRKLRSNLMITKSLLTPKYECSKSYNTIQTNQLKQKQYHDRNAYELLDLQENQEVMVQTSMRNWTPAKVTRKCNEPESYDVITSNGTPLRRNRVHLRPLRISTKVKNSDSSEKAEHTKPIPNSDYVNNNKTEVSEQKLDNTKPTLTLKDDNLNKSAEYAELSDYEKAEQSKTISISDTLNKSVENKNDYVNKDYVNSRPKRVITKPAYLRDFVQH